ncbi:MAG: hydrogenase maturation nickel metallochaperone HypA [Gemmatimonadales bacterium]|jgi:hydrogenase nickel incorporation protein HypA/HybF
MHEASIALNLIEAVEQRLESQPGHVTAIHVRVGELAGVSTEALDFAFQCLSAGTPLASARLVFEVIPLTMTCDACGRTSGVEDLVFRCPACGSENTRISTGRELEVRTLELAEEPEVAHASN